MMMRHRAATLLRIALASVAASACGGEGAHQGTGPAPALTANGPAGPLTVGTTYLSPYSWLEYAPGSAPLIIVAPHGGSVSPAELPDRVCTNCVTGTDLGTQELSRAISDAFARRTGVRPHLVVNRLHRRKFDGNRELVEATDSHAPLAPTWAWLQSAVDSAKLRVTAAHGRGLLIDLHGHGHSIARLELGYLLGASDLRRTDAALTSSGDMTRTSVARLATDARSGERGTALLRGPNSLGTLLAGAGVPSVPSAATPAPLVGEEYFDGGFNTARNGSSSGGAIDAIQIETHYTGVRDNATSRSAFADVLAGVLVQYLERHYGWRP